MREDGLEVVTSFEIFGQTVECVKDPNHEADFKNDVVKENFLGTGFNVTETIMNTWIIMAIIIIFAIATRITMKHWKDVPTGFQNAIEGIIEIFENFVRNTMGEHNMGFAPFYFSVFVFVLLCNLSGLFALRCPTADYATTLALGLITFFMIQGFNIAKNGLWSYLKGFTQPLAILLPMNIVSEFATPISLSFRLFGNLLAGTIIMALFYSMPYWFMKIGVPAVLHFYFDLFSGCLQAFIFTMLSMTFVSNVIPVPEEQEEVKE